ncbi:hypothetical protein BX661DRAFT_185066 [Kickxella alabastrina]|uniref:uncharacterized protein n=1 Tax=Kickxella alabastrina TaxID=61397 RepID=UPI00221F2B23|nr:uncharacterized protein BX661DRAFT_185066 [Kickxella alabastrina]KAI7824987.1 hypothetical protein BX661DRAFT_185066 [Kickxella alabastrina]KAJ1945672.1 asparagine-linked glycosylation protein [Kickxella alabastrina]
MATLDSAIRLCFVTGILLLVVLLGLLAVRMLTLGSQTHQQSNRSRIQASTTPDTSAHPAYYIGFFHPFPNAGGGGERVLWTMIQALQTKYPFLVSIIYSGDQIPLGELLANVREKFGLEIRPETIYVVELRSCWWVVHRFRRLTLLLQSLGSVVLASEALHGFCPDVFVDTVGYAFAYPLVRLVGSGSIPVVAYTHYPTISSDMQTLVASREAGIANDPTVAASLLLTQLKRLYYTLFAHMYAFAGSFAATIMTNSSWTHAHIIALFGNPRMTRIVYPPCDTANLAGFALSPRVPAVVSLAQFRPEKNHEVQVRAFARLLADCPQMAAPKHWMMPADNDNLDFPVLVMIGGARNLADEARAETLRQLADSLGVGRQVKVVVNAPWDNVLQWLRRGSVGLHTMRDEHFGINIVEMMAAGLLTIAHDSAGPKMDIVTPAIRCQDTGAPPLLPDVEQQERCLREGGGSGFPVGMVARSVDEFAMMMRVALTASDTLREAMQCAARASVTAKFSEDAFRTAFYRRFDPVLKWLDIQQLDSE